MAIQDTTQVVEVSSNIWRPCPVAHCGGINHNDDLPTRVNHLIGHGYRLLHVGQQNEMDNQGHPYPTTVAILGR